MTGHLPRAIPLFADAGVPMIFLTMPAMAVLLVPVIAIEAFLCRKWLGLSTWQAIKSNTVSNLASTIVGMPIAWTGMLVIEFGVFGLASNFKAVENWNSPLAKVISIVLSSAWLGPPGRNDAWVIPLATLVLLIPFFFASYWIEYLTVRWMVGIPDEQPPKLSYPRVRKAVRNANLVTYGLMFLGTSIWLVLLLARH